MDSVTQTQAAPGLGPIGNTASSSGDSSVEEGLASLTSDFDTFLQLLTAQIRNQDPSEPIDSTQFVSQLASFSGLEQQLNTNSKLDELIAQNVTSDAKQLSAWIGTSVQSIAATQYDDAPVDVFYTVPSSASSVKLRVEGPDGTLVSRIPVDSNSSSFTWDGLDQSGEPAEAGLYTFQLETYKDGKYTGALPATTFSRVVEARQEENGITLVFADGSRQLADDVNAVR